MKKIAKLAFFFSNSFILLFLFSAGFYFLDLWIESVRVLSIEPDLSGSLVSSFAWAVPVALYISILLCHTYAVRKKVSAFASILMVIVLSCVFTFAALLGVQHFQKVGFTMNFESEVGKQPGLILSRGESAMVILSRDGFRGPRVVSFPDQDLLYQGEDWGPVNTVLAPALPFGDAAPWSIHSMFIDFALSARQLDMRLREGFSSFLVYGGSLIVFLGSLRIILGLSVWPLANLFLGALIFRGILSLETFLNMPETQHIISSFLGERVSPALITPLVFLGLGILIILYTFLSRLAWGKRRRYD